MANPYVILSFIAIGFALLSVFAAGIAVWHATKIIKSKPSIRDTIELNYRMKQNCDWYRHQLDNADEAILAWVPSDHPQYAISKERFDQRQKEKLS